MVNSPEAYDITRKIKKCCSNAQDHGIAAGGQELVYTDPLKFMVPELKVSATLVYKIVRKDLRYKSYGLRKGQFMGEATKLEMVGEGTKAPELPEAPGNRKFGPLAAQTATPLTIMSGVFTEGDVNKSPKILRSP